MYRCISIDTKNLPHCPQELLENLKQQKARDAALSPPLKSSVFTSLIVQMIHAPRKYFAQSSMIDSCGAVNDQGAELPRMFAFALRPHT